MAIVALVLLGTGWARAEAAPPHLFIIGQDLASVREYQASHCCPPPDGQTFYLNFYDLLSAERGFGGLGMDVSGNPVDEDADWGAGPANAWKSAKEFGGVLAIGLFIAENGNPGALGRLVSGEYDSHIVQLARFFKRVDLPVLLRIGYEFDGPWNVGYEDTDRYVKAFRRIVDGIRAEGAEQVRYVWQWSASPAQYFAPRNPTDFVEWYPGDSYVDWVAFSIFMHPDEQPRIDTTRKPRTQRELIEGLLAFARQHDKPVMVAESAPRGFDLANGTHANPSPDWDGPAGEDRRSMSAEEIWQDWYAPMFALLEEHRDLIRAFAYINCNWDAQDMWDAPYDQNGYWGDTRLQANEYVAQRFSEALERWRNPPPTE